MNTDPLLPGFDYLTLHTSAARLRVAVKGSGPPLLLLHGYPQTHLAWHRIAPRLAEDYSVVLADLRGYGESRALDEEGADYSKAALARDQLETMGQLGFERFAVIGHDRGARVGYRLALDHPQAVAAFVSLTVVPILDNWAAVNKAFALNAYHWFLLAQPYDLPERLIGADPEHFLDYTLRAGAPAGVSRQPPGGAPMSAVERDPAAQATLWRQRVFEVHAAMSAYVAERHRREDLGDWVATSARIFADLPATDDLRAEAWQAVFFRAQALIEQFIVARPADYRLDDWARATARIYRALEPAGRGDPASAADRLARQAALYGSRFEVQAEADGRAVFHNRHCAIWDYRERARARGVPITLESACTYCTKLLSAFVAASDCRADWRLYEEPQGHGCVWTITADSLNQGAGVHERDH
ncbi:alpha/beta fold hydrolase [Pseudomonas aeruginosa]|nr:alpha/beta fold hydrolase [Pseudomonas aeruginosa]